MRPPKQPTVCNLCNGRVQRVSNAVIYGRAYGSKLAYRCNRCLAYVGTHHNGDALGLLSNQSMRYKKRECHRLFDPIWKKGRLTRSGCYIRLAMRLGIEDELCHFGYFNDAELDMVLDVLKHEKWWEEPICVNMGG